MAKTAQTPVVILDTNRHGVPYRTPNKSGQGSHRFTGHANVDLPAPHAGYRAAIYQTARACNLQTVEVTLYHKGRMIPETQLKAVRAAVIAAYVDAFGLLPMDAEYAAPEIKAGDSVQVDAGWLKACGKGQWVGQSFTVTSVQAMPAQGESMFHVLTPDGDSWAVWSIRGVTLAPAPVTESTIAFLLSSSDCRRTHGDSTLRVVGNEFEMSAPNRAPHRLALSQTDAARLDSHWQAYCTAKAAPAPLKLTPRTPVTLAPATVANIDSHADLITGVLPRTIDCTPTWQALVPALVAMIENGTAQSRAMAIEEFTRLARFADATIAEGKAKRAANG